MLSRLVITFLPRSKHLLISWLQSPSVVILEPRKIVILFPLFPHLYTIEYYSAIKKNAVESILMRWINLEPIIQSEVSQKEINIIL